MMLFSGIISSVFFIDVINPFFFCLLLGACRLAGATLIAPVVNYWWPGFPANLSKEAYYLQLPQDQWALRVAHYTPRLTYWWNTQKWFPASAVAAKRPEVFSRKDLELLSMGAFRKQKVLCTIIKSFCDRLCYFQKV